MNWINRLKQANVGEIFENEPLSKHTSWKIGGVADGFIIPKNREKLVETILILTEEQIPWKVIGKGSNLLVRDRGYRGAILHLDSADFEQIEFNEHHVLVGANVSIIRLANLAAKKSLTGFEFAGGIPGKIGGAVYMNAGAHGSDISKILVEAEILLENGRIVKWSNQEFDFAYRTSRLQKEKGILLSVLFQLKLGDRKEIIEQMVRFKERRTKTQPYHLPCAGSVFRNPEGDYAARLIEELGLKGYQIGGAQISMMHANFIVNVGQATANDVLSLIQTVQDKVWEAYKIRLKPEVEVIGEG
ncbi:UDP-N-acetylmuramate dehydrogenase [Tepidibacillus fermentans]|uniref:UDP-N-acetylenolpyruvoylglucosamine reductase n=1 Tax=Tepidibacillus fermentans TaxID=1281767 RepID=A0A4R3KLD1_9BACI|nr:UDP-N-acetylmuramate dehydrogenase [Tepidibacillus fermentans]TCS84412.1 UDP-N-acetylmuramate dehydrogenase [Tepidibacillus fermentans]